MPALDFNRQELLDRFISVCREKGLKVTPQRLLIYKEMISTGEHPAAEDVFRRARKRFPTISLATIYKTIETFVRVGLLNEFRPSLGGSRFCANPVHHHHLVCRVCLKVTDILDKELEGIRLSRIDAEGFAAESYTVEIEGICAGCQDQG